MALARGTGGRRRGARARSSSDMLGRTPPSGIGGRWTSHDGRGRGEPPDPRVRPHALGGARTRRRSSGSAGTPSPCGACRRPTGAARLAGRRRQRRHRGPGVLSAPAAPPDVAVAGGVPQRRLYCAVFRFSGEAWALPTPFVWCRTSGARRRVTARRQEVQMSATAERVRQLVAPLIDRARRGAVRRGACRWHAQGRARPTRRRRHGHDHRGHPAVSAALDEADIVPRPTPSRCRAPVSSARCAHRSTSPVPSVARSGSSCARAPTATVARTGRWSRAETTTSRRRHRARGRSRAIVRLDDISKAERPRRLGAAAQARERAKSSGQRRPTARGPELADTPTSSDRRPE